MSGAREVEQGRFRRKLYLMVAGMLLGGRREAGSVTSGEQRERESVATTVVFKSGEDEIV